MRRRGQRTSRPDLPGGVTSWLAAAPPRRGHDRSSPRRPSGRRRSSDPGGPPIRATGARGKPPTIVWRALPGSVRSSSVLVVEDPGCAGRRLHPLDGVGHLRSRPAPAWRPTGSSRPASQRGPELRRQGRLDAAPARPRRATTPITNTFSLLRAEEAGARARRLSPRRRCKAVLEGALGARDLNKNNKQPGTYQRARLYRRAGCTRAFLVARVALRLDRDVVGVRAVPAFVTVTRSVFLLPGGALRPPRARPRRTRDRRGAEDLQRRVAEARDHGHLGRPAPPAMTIR